MAERTRRVGLLKAVGGTPGTVAVVLLAENLVLALAAAAAGLAIGVAGRPAARQPRRRPGRHPRRAGVQLVHRRPGGGRGPGVALASTLVPAIRAARTSTVSALADSARRPRRHGALIRLSRRLPVPLLLGMRLIARRPRRALLSTASVAVTAGGIVAVLAFHTTVHLNAADTVERPGQPDDRPGRADADGADRGAGRARDPERDLRGLDHRAGRPALLGARPRARRDAGTGHRRDSGGAGTTRHAGRAARHSAGHRPLRRRGQAGSESSSRLSGGWPPRYSAPSSPSPCWPRSRPLPTRAGRCPRSCSPKRPDVMGRIWLIGRLVGRDLRYRPGPAVLLVLAITAATATLTLGLVLHGVTNQPYLQTRAATKGPDVVAQLGGRAAGRAGRRRPYRPGPRHRSGRSPGTRGHRLQRALPGRVGGRAGPRPDRGRRSRRAGPGSGVARSAEGDRGDLGAAAAASCSSARSPRRSGSASATGSRSTAGRSGWWGSRSPPPVCRTRTSAIPPAAGASSTFQGGSRPPTSGSPGSPSRMPARSPRRRRRCPTS